MIAVVFGVLFVAMVVVEVLTLRKLGLLKQQLDEPLIWTTKGNLPVSVLQCKCGWFESDEDTTFIEEYQLETGNGEFEVVRRSAHVRSKKGVEALSLSAETN